MEAIEAIEAVVLAGGASRRMGQDKARLPLGGQPAALALAHRLATVCEPVTLLGIDLPGPFSCLPDATPGSGPLAALAGFAPSRPLVFVLSCDVPRFDARLIAQLGERLGEADAALPLVDGRIQPLCGLYRASAFERFREAATLGGRALREGLQGLTVREVDLEACGLDVRWAAGANDPETWARLARDE